MSEKLRIAVVGLGKMGLLHASILKVLPNVDVAVLCEKSNLTRMFFKKVFKNLPLVNDVEKLGDFGLDAVYVTTPIPSHFSVARLVFVNKIAGNLFVEKTLASSHDEARQLCDLAEQSGGVNMVGYLRRFYVTFRKAKDILEQGTIGELSVFRAYAYSSDFLDNEGGSKASAVRGGLLSDLGCYAMDLALWFFGDLDIKSAKANEFDGKRNQVETIQFELSQAKRITGVCDVSWCMRDYRMPEVGFRIEGSKGVLEVNDDKIEYKLRNGEARKWYRHDLNDNVPFWLAAPEYFREDAYFISCISKACKAEPCFESASKVDLMIDQVKKNLGLGD